MRLDSAREIPIHPSPAPGKGFDDFPYNPSMHVNLIPHPSHPCASIDTFDVSIESDAKAITLRYRITGNVDEILVPERRAPERQDGLWQHTCFEWFARSTSGSRYCELNFSPSTCWAAYEFGDYRAGMRRLGYSTAPRIEVTRNTGLLALSVNVERSTIDTIAQDGLRIAIAAVIERRDGGKSYWALAHPSAEPDFHHPHAFTLALPAGVAR